jgi:hypothetical protein
VVIAFAEASGTRVERVCGIKGETSGSAPVPEHMCHEHSPLVDLAWRADDGAFAHRAIPPHGDHGVLTCRRAAEIPSQDRAYSQ